ncbi:MAG TPA: DUF362 domain-containing protein, partial [Chthoniobacterales bacterium]|nr:DUF362 domain-containing protein [Chthoniobacterales bacterium]
MNRRAFLYAAATSPLLAAAADEVIPNYRISTHFAPAAKSGMPGAYAGQVVRVFSDKSIDSSTARVDRAVVKQMLSAGMRSLTGQSRDEECWARLFEPQDVVGLKVNCSGAPHIMSSPELIAGIVENLMAIGVPARNIWIYERFGGQVESAHYDKYVPADVHIWTAEPQWTPHGSLSGYDPNTYVEVNFFGEEDTRSFMVRPAAQTFTKIINVPKMKEHQAAGVTGCLKNISYGNFSNVDRSHRFAKTNTYSFVGTLASVEPLKSKTVLNIMDGLSSVWHAGPFSQFAQFRFYPKQILFGTDPVAMDHVVIDTIEAKRKAEGAPSLFDRSPSHLGNDNADPKFNHFIREPGHVEYASRLGLGVYDTDKIKIIGIQ